MFRSVEREGAQLVEECSALLDGRLAEELADRGRPRPSWCWLNRLAHGSIGDVRRCAGSLPGAPPSDRWARATAFLAGELLAATDRGTTLRALQQEVLIPLELDLLASTQCPMWDPAHFVLDVLARLEAWDESQRFARRRARG